MNNFDFLIGFLIVVEILVSIMLILVILVQPSKSGGLGGASFGGGMGEQLFGARTGNVLTKATVILGAVFVMNTLGLAFLYSRKDPVADALPSGPVITGEAGMSGGLPEVPEEPSGITEEPAPDEPEAVPEGEAPDVETPEAEEVKAETPDAP